MYKLIYTIIGGWVLAHLLWLGIIGTSSDLSKTGNSLFMILGAVVSTIMLVVAARRHPNRPFTQRLFLLLLFGNMSLAIGETAELIVSQQHLERSGTFDGIDLVFSLQIGFYLLAFCYFLISRRSEVNLRFFLFDELIILIVTGAISWHYLVTPYLEQAELFSMETLLLLRYPLGDLLLLGGMLILFFGVMKRGNSIPLSDDFDWFSPTTDCGFIICHFGSNRFSDFFDVARSDLACDRLINWRGGNVI